MSIQLTAGLLTANNKKGGRLSASVNDGRSFSACGKGVGFLLVDAEGQGNTAGVFVAIVMLTLIGVLAYGAVVWAEKRVLHYMPKAMLSTQ